ncbi:FAD/NAD(P)-binding domain-containing protein [Annulohypoxylon stygium]|nr:FAD/NAD(P)-binding domain-containing protein [Annulohypoxylon stygium]
MSKSNPPKFRAIVVGAGPVGLYLAHALSKAGIDYLIFEQHDSVLRHQGAGILVYPHMLRLLDQIGLYDKADDYIINRNMTDLLVRNGKPMIGFSRGQLIALLYENLPEKETRIRTGATVVDIETHEKGAKVHLRDGSIEECSIVIGVAGVYSLYGCFDSSCGLEPGTFYQSRGTGIVTQVMAKENRGYFAILRAISPTAEPKRYTTESRDCLAEELANIVVAPGVHFKDLWGLTVKDTAAMVNQEEGYCDSWYHGRIVLVGDAVHKVTSVTGMGANIGINAAAALANELYRALQSDPNPRTERIEDAFKRYQDIRDREARRLHTLGRMQIRGVTWSTWSDWLFDRFVNPWIGVNKWADLIGKLIKRGQILEYVPFEDREVQVPWVYTSAA